MKLACSLVCQSSPLDNIHADHNRDPEFKKSVKAITDCMVFAKVGAKHRLKDSNGGRTETKAMFTKTCKLALLPLLYQLNR